MCSSESGSATATNRISIVTMDQVWLVVEEASTLRSRGFWWGSRSRVRHERGHGIYPSGSAGSARRDFVSGRPEGCVSSDECANRDRNRAEGCIGDIKESSIMQLRYPVALDSDQGLTNCRETRAESSCVCIPSSGRDKPNCCTDHLQMLVVSCQLHHLYRPLSFE